MSSYEKPRKKVVRFNLITGEEQYASQTAQNPITSRRVSSLIPTLAGELERERPRPKYSTSVALPAAVTWLHKFDKKASDGTFTRHYFAFSNSKLYKDISGTWTEVTAIGTLSGIPDAANINNLMHLSDDNVSWIFDGTNWIEDGFPIPTESPELVVDVGRAWFRGTGLDDMTSGGTFSGGTISLWRVIIDATGAPDTFKWNKNGGSFTTGVSITGAAQALSDGVTVTFDATTGHTVDDEWDLEAMPSGTLTIVTNRFYWSTFGDDGSAALERIHESSSSPRSLGTGAVTNKKVRVYQQPGILNGTSGSPNVSGVGTDFKAAHVGLHLRVSGNDLGTIDSVTDSLNLVLTDNLPLSLTRVHYLIIPARANAWHVYASEAENSGVGLILKKLGVTTSMSFDDESPFVGNTGTLFGLVERPVRNDQTVGSEILTVHRSRIFRRRKTFPNFFNLTAVEEVEAGNNGSPQESVPGVDANTISDLVNEASVPDESDVIKAMVSHGDALYIGTEDDLFPLYGGTIAEFAISQVTNFKVGVAGRFGMVSTPFGLAFVSHGKKAYIYPEQGAPPADVEATAILKEFGQPQRKKLELIKGSELEDVRTKYYKWGRRNWFVLTYQDTSSVYHTLIYDFDINGWAELTGTIASLATWEVGEGDTVLVGGGTDGFVYILDDLTGTYSISGINFPEGNFRPALMDFGRPDERNLFRYLEYEVSNENLPVEVRYWFDPVDVDNPGTGIVLNMGKLTNSANRFRGFPTQGGFCQRLLVEIKILAGTEVGTIRGIVVKADPVSNLAV